MFSEVLVKALIHHKFTIRILNNASPSSTTRPLPFRPTTPTLSCNTNTDLDSTSFERVPINGASSASRSPDASRFFLPSPATTLPAQDFTTFQRTDSPAVRKALGVTPKHYRQLEPSLYYLSQRYAEKPERRLSLQERHTRLVALAQFIDSKRSAVTDNPVIGPGCNLIGLLDPDHGLDPKEILSLAKAYGCTSIIFKKTEPSETLETVGDKFLQSVAEAVQSRGHPNDRHCT